MIVMLPACYSVIDSTFTATSSVFVVDIIKPLFPKIGEKQLFFWAKAPMFSTAVIAAAVILTGADFCYDRPDKLRDTDRYSYPVGSGVVLVAHNWMGIVGGTILAIAIGMHVRDVIKMIGWCIGYRTDAQHHRCRGGHNGQTMIQYF
jgi:hypothetical protein